MIETIAGVRDAVRTTRCEGKRVGLVPTMGALHVGHESLIARSVAECGVTVVSIFVNPIQFNQPEDFEKYPRELEHDVAACERMGAEIVFAPANAEMYPRPLEMHVEPGKVAEHLCGPFRPGHFRGVATVVAKLFHAVEADRAYFGEKDAQQLAVIQRMVSDLNMAVEIVPVATVRESDGLAMSSRNARLGVAARRAAPVLYAGLQVALEKLEGGERDAGRVRAAAMAVIAVEPQVRVEYLDVVDAGTMQPLERVEGPVRVAVAAWLGGVRLIDNVGFSPWPLNISG
ncbi:MAG: pantoate--beta-alanine ligase [Acidobacteriota bacterium]